MPAAPHRSPIRLAALLLAVVSAGTFAQDAWTAPTLARTPLGRLGEPEDIAQAIAFLASPAAANHSVGCTLAPSLKIITIID